MAQIRDRVAAQILNSLPQLPLEERLWSAVVKELRLSPRQAAIVELTLRDAANKQIATALGISEPTLKSHQERIAMRTGTRGRMQLAMRVLALALEINGQQKRGRKG